MVQQIADDEEGVSVKGALCLGFAAFLRSEELTWDIRSHEVKTDQSHVGVEIHLAHSPCSPLCPVMALRTLFNRYPAPLDAPLFIRPFGQPFDRSFFILTMHHLLLDAGISTVGYSGHSLRKGAAVTADRNGISRHDIKLLGRWKSDAVDVYIDERQKPDHIRKILHLNAQLLSPLH